MPSRFLQVSDGAGGVSGSMQCSISMFLIQSVRMKRVSFDFFF